MKAREGLSYAAAGVDIAAYEAALERVRPLIEAASGRIGEFAGTYELPGLGHLVASADGVGTKIKVAIALGRHRGIGADLVNHCVNDIAVMRARPLFFLDYFATGKLDPDVFEDVVAGGLEVLDNFYLERKSCVVGRNGYLHSSFFASSTMRPRFSHLTSFIGQPRRSSISTSAMPAC